MSDVAEPPREGLLGPSQLWNPTSHPLHRKGRCYCGEGYGAISEVGVHRVAAYLYKYHVESKMNAVFSL